MDRNYRTLKSVLGGMQPIRKDAVLLLVANPVDVLTHFTQQLSGLPKNQVLGSGTLLDSIRLRSQIAEKLGVSLPYVHEDGRLITTQVADSNISAHVLGEHGDSQFVRLSLLFSILTYELRSIGQPRPSPALPSPLSSHSMPQNAPQ